MKSETKSCQNCKNKFTIEPDDFGFYEKIQVPPPTWCAQCRAKRRYAWRNESALYKRPCNLCGASIVSMYHSDVPFPVYCQPCWWSDKWDPRVYGADYDFSKPFFEQFRELFKRTPQSALVNNPSQSINSEYCNYAIQNKNCYLLFASHYNEQCSYCWYVFQNKDTLDSMETHGVELVYEGNLGMNLYNCAFVEYVFDSNNCFFSYDLSGCNDCFLSWNLRNKKYCILNQQYSKEEYLEKIKEFNTGSYIGLQLLLERFKQVKDQAIRIFSYKKNTVNCTGNDIVHSKNVQNSFRVQDSEDVKNAQKATATFTSMDVSRMGYDRSELCYETISCTALNNAKFGQALWHCNGAEYGNHNFSSTNVFGCISAKKNEYCILNKQYSKEEYQALRGKIIQHMKDMPYTDSIGRIYIYGEFFPPEMSPFMYNESNVNEWYPLSKSEAVKRGYRWRETDPREYQKQTFEIPDHIQNVSEGILKEILACSDCGKNYRIIDSELKFYKRQNLPIPRKCPWCRQKTRMGNRTPLDLWDRQCMCERAGHSSHATGQCQNKFETSYSLDRPEIVYCEQCYQQEVV